MTIQTKQNGGCRQSLATPYDAGFPENHKEVQSYATRWLVDQWSFSQEPANHRSSQPLLQREDRQRSNKVQNTLSKASCKDRKTSSSKPHLAMTVSPRTITYGSWYETDNRETNLSTKTSKAFAAQKRNIYWKRSFEHEQLHNSRKTYSVYKNHTSRENRLRWYFRVPCCSFEFRFHCWPIKSNL